ncbi:hypothetical protein [Ligilactobacillus murinus]|uniref:hypothetical protein n=1 Tax=Ligilactobacillus murinus TaxID=1622 RepID=UPI000A782E46|nr:hypothetical protein [Ligilactobacillus murinus]
MNTVLVTFDFSSNANNSKLAIDLRATLETLPNTKWFQHLPSEVILVTPLSTSEIFETLKADTRNIRIFICDISNAVTNSHRTTDWLSQNSD